MHIWCGLLLGLTRTLPETTTGTSIPVFAFLALGLPLLGVLVAVTRQRVTSTATESVQEFWGQTPTQPDTDTSENNTETPSSPEKLHTMEIPPSFYER